MKKLFSVAAALLMSVAFFAGCNNIPDNNIDELEYTTKSYAFYYMNAEADLIISDKFGSDKKNKFDGLCSEIDTTLSSVDSSLSVNVKTSAISAFNGAEAGETVPIDYTAYRALNIAKSVYELTEGYYNPAVYYSVQAYGFNDAFDESTPLKDRIPPESVTASYTSLAAHFGEIELYQGEDNKYYAVKPSATVQVNGETLSLKIDLGGIGKGIAVDEVNALIDKHGFSCGFFSFGSSSIVCKEHYKNGEYTLTLTNPRADAESGFYAKVGVKDKCLSSSGDYQQYFILDGKRYSHVFNPKTGRPVETGIMSATVIGGTAAEGDALTTAIMAMERDRAVKFMEEKLSSLGVAFSYDDGGSYLIYTNIEGLQPAHSAFKVQENVAEKD